MTIKKNKRTARPDSQAKAGRGGRGPKKTERLDQGTLADALSFERMLSGLSAEFIQFPMERFEALIEDVQRRVCEYFGLDMSTLWQSSRR